MEVSRKDKKEEEEERMKRIEWMKRKTWRKERREGWMRSESKDEYRKGEQGMGEERWMPGVKCSDSDEPLVTSTPFPLPTPSFTPSSGGHSDK